MKIFTDTNVLVSAFTARGLCADLLEVILADHQLITGEIVLTELERVLTKKLNVPQNKVSKTLLFLRKYQIEPIPDKPSDVKVRDEDDRCVLESALRAKADILVTGDKDLLVIANNVPQLKIISPRGFWELLKE
ncbi:putative toxin-antitoxin system toxin component, PIN family [Gracilimonas sediminicola]|uniref:Toxin-antitoxin system toxin component, PIN family n=1 Tax=Gracilimonas sediminicola TaxID=2952158 RepID=A0A9X2L094_9BACT|nr:putative toxin-antitoxin system toxin component, PIN family [Gracilimonas sediminicola]